MPANVQTKRAYEPAEPDDGYRVLIDHVWPRGVSRERAQLDALAARAEHGRVTVVYAARDREHNNAVVLAELLRDHK